MLTVQFVQSIRSDVVGSYRLYDDVSGDDVASDCWLVAGESDVDTW
jgi:hypothetical protein